jgi:RNA polymerase sigma-70 factor (ECF subfamily)
MAASESTSWGMLDAAAAGDQTARTHFAARYEPLVRAYFAARWRHSPLIHELDDAVQDVFVECLRSGGILDRAQPDRPGGFRAFLYGLVRNVARRIEARRVPHPGGSDAVDPNAIAAREDTLSHVFDRAWAKAIMREAAEHQAAFAAVAGADAMRRLELLRLRFQEDLPIREIAERWHTDAALLHRDYAKARDEFRTALKNVLATHHAIAGEALDRECAELLALLA